MHHMLAGPWLGHDLVLARRGLIFAAARRDEASLSCERERSVVQRGVVCGTAGL